MQLENSGKNCWVKCENKQGKCDWCGKGGFCCRKGFHDTSHGCDGSFGGDSEHECVLKPRQYCIYQDENESEEFSRKKYIFYLFSVLVIKTKNVSMSFGISEHVDI